MSYPVPLWARYPAMPYTPGYFTDQVMRDLAFERRLKQLADEANRVRQMRTSQAKDHFMRVET